MREGQFDGFRGGQGDGKIGKTGAAFGNIWRVHGDAFFCFADAVFPFARLVFKFEGTMVERLRASPINWFEVEDAAVEKRP